MKVLLTRILHPYIIDIKMLSELIINIEYGDQMKSVLIIGGGIAGCTVARTLSGFAIPSTILEVSSSIGGKVRQFGCKADAKCSQCGVCAAGNLWHERDR